MRLMITTLASASLLLAVNVLAAEPQAPVTSQAPAAAAPSTPQADAPSAVAETTRAQPAPKEEKQAEAASKVTGEPSRDARERELEAEAMKRMGFTVKQIRGETYYCKKKVALGSRLNPSNTCMPYDVAVAQMSDAQNAMRQKVIRSLNDGDGG